MNPSSQETNLSSLQSKPAQPLQTQPVHTFTTLNPSINPNIPPTLSNYQRKMNRQTHLLSKATFAQNTRYNNRYRQMRIDRVTLGYDLRLERLRQGLTQEQVGVLSDLSAGTIRRAEKYGLVSVRAFYLITNALGKQLTIK